MRFTMTALSAAVIFATSANELLEQAEDAVRYSTIHVDEEGHILDSDDEDALAWAADMHTLRLGEDGVEDEVLPSIAVGATEATLMDAPSAHGIAVLGRKQLSGRLKVEVLESQLVVVHGMESTDDRKRREAAGVHSDENVMASELACRPIRGTAMFLLVHRHPIPGSPHVHELAFFDRALWDTFVEYMRRARASADFFGGPASWAMRIHWNTMPREQREPWILRRALLRVAASPTIRQP